MSFNARKWQLNPFSGNTAARLLPAEPAQRITSISSGNDMKIIELLNEFNRKYRNNPGMDTNHMCQMKVSQQVAVSTEK